MPPTITHLAYRVALITETLEAHADWPKRLANAGLPGAQLEAGRARLVEAFDLMDKVAEHVDDHTTIEQGRRAITELALWQETYGAFWRPALGAQVNDAQWGTLTGANLEGHDDEFTVLMRAWRFISAIRTAEKLHAPLRAARPRLEDELQRGMVVCAKAVKLLHKRHSLRGDERRHGVGQGELEVCARELERWLQDFAAAAQRCFAGEPGALGLLGVVPDGIGLPLGGTGRDVMLHERAQREPPSGPAIPCEQWGVGTAGNRENYWQG